MTKAVLSTNDFFLSAVNPLATADQRDLEALALEIIQTPAVQQAKEVARARWKRIIEPLNPDAEAWSRFDTFLDEFILHYTLKAVNSDPNYPRIVRYNMLPHEWFGRKVPGTRQGGGDNWDNTYALIPVEYGAAYEFEVQCFDPGPADVTWSLMGNLLPTMTLGVLTGKEMVAGADGRYVVTMNNEPANGRPNHLQLSPDSRYVFMRESLSDWRQIPAAIRVKRITPPRTPKLSKDDLIARAARYVVDEIPNTYWWNVVAASAPMNAITPAAPITALGGLVTQQTSFGKADFGEDEAMLVTVEGGGAPYHSFGLYDFWFNALDYANHTTSMNNAQAAPNPDGSITYVIAHKDPGVRNWIATEGVRRLYIVQRWQDLPVDYAGKKPAIEGKVVKLSDLKNLLPAGVPMASASERQAQRKERLDAFHRRFAV